MTIARAAAILIATLMGMLFSNTAHAAAPARGHLDNITATNGELVAAGWTVDPAHTSQATTIRITLDGRPFTTRGTTTVRADVDRQLRITGVHGYRAAFTVPAGQHMVCVDALTAAGAATPQGCAQVTVQALATVTQMRQLAARIDPNHTMTWHWQPATFAPDLGWSRPWDGRIDLMARIPAANLYSVMIHEWAHVQQYRAGWDVTLKAANAALNRPYSGGNLFSIERLADCMAKVQGATWFGYGCPAALLPLAHRTITAAE